MDSGKQAWPEHKENGAGSVRDQVQETASVLRSRRDPSHAEGPIWPPWPCTGRGAPLSQLCTAPIAVPRGSPEPRDRLAHPNQLRPLPSRSGLRWRCLREPRQGGCGPQELAGLICKEEQRTESIKDPFFLSPVMLRPSRHPFPPAPSKTQKNKSSCLLPPPPPHPKETFKRISGIKHTEFLRRELAGLPWLPLP